MVDRLPVGSPGLLFHSSNPSGVSGKLSVPVNPQSEVYARFRHVVGVSAAEGGQGVPLMKLRILDNLIESYVKARARSPSVVRGEDLVVRVNARTVDTVIAALSADIHEDLAARPARPGDPTPNPGAVLSLGV